MALRISITPDECLTACFAHADKDNDEVYAQMELQPINSETDVFPILSLGSYAKSKHPVEYFSKNLTASDTSTHAVSRCQEEPQRSCVVYFLPSFFSIWLLPIVFKSPIFCRREDLKWD